MISIDFLKAKISMSFFLYLVAIISGCLCGYLDVAQPLAKFISEVFTKIFKCLSLPIIAISLIVSLSKQSHDFQLKKIGRRTLFYTISTTLAASTVACVLYLLIAPSNITQHSEAAARISFGKYSDYIMNMIPSNVFSPFLEYNVMGALLIGIVL